MASVFVCTEPYSDIDYSLVDGRIRAIVIRGDKLYDEDDGTAVDGWRDKLTAFVLEHGLDVEHNGRGLHAFVYRMRGDGLLPGS